MPFIAKSSYEASWVFRNGHINTIYPAFFRRVEGVHYQRERLTTPDGDFLDLDWSKIGSSKLHIALHGLEGNSENGYLKGMVKFLNEKGWDGLALNFRGCSGEMNRYLNSYHIGHTEDLRFVIHHLIDKGCYNQIIITGFSLGGNVLLKYLGEESNRLPSAVLGAVAFSVPVDVKSANDEFKKWYNWQYSLGFLKPLNKKMVKKSEKHPELLEKLYPLPKSLKEFDDRFTAPLNGFLNAQDYWKKCSSKGFIDKITIPVLLVNAADDSFLGEGCYPIDLAEASSSFYLEVPEHGGHIGFVSGLKDSYYWSEKRAYDFFHNLRMI